MVYQNGRKIMIYVKTQLGQRLFNDHSLLNPRQRFFYIMCDGKRHAEDVLSSPELAVTQEDLDQMLSLGLLAPYQPGSDVVQSSDPPAKA